MDRLHELNEQIKVLKQARDVLKAYYANSDFHKEKEKNPHSVVPSTPHDEGIYKLLIAIQQLEFFIKKLQDEQFKLMKKEEE